MGLEDFTGLIMAELLLHASVFTVERRRYPQAGGEPVVRDVVVHPGAVVILPRLADGSVVMVRQYRHAVERELWELPAGTLEPPEETPPVGGIGLEPELGTLPLETAGSSGSGTGVLAGMAAAATAGAIALGGAAWYARRRLTR